MWGRSCLSCWYVRSAQSLWRVLKIQALVYLFQMVVILYPPFAIFNVFHAHFIQKREEDFSKRLFVEKRRAFG